MFGFINKGKGSAVEKKNASGFYIENYATYAPKDYKLPKYAKEGFMQNSIVHKIVCDIAESASGVNLIPMRRDKEDFNSDFAKLVSEPNAFQSQPEFINEIVSCLMIYGEAFVLAMGVSDDSGRLKSGNVKPAGLVVYNPELVSVKVRPNGTPEYYEIGCNGKKRYYVDPVTGESSILHIKNYNPHNVNRGLSPMMACGYEVDLYNLAMAWNNGLLGNGARPSMVVRTKGTMGDEEFAALKEQFDRLYSGASNAGKPLLIEGETEVDVVGSSPRDMDFVNTVKMAIQNIAQAYKYPLPLVTTDASSYNNVTASREHLYENSILPQLNFICMKISSFLSNMMGDDYSLKYDEDSISALEPKRQRKFERAVKSVEAGINTRAEAREMLGFEPVTDMNADVLTVSAGTVPLDSIGADSTPISDDVKAIFADLETKGCEKGCNND